MTAALGARASLSLHRAPPARLAQAGSASSQRRLRGVERGGRTAIHAAGPGSSGPATSDPVQPASAAAKPETDGAPPAAPAKPSAPAAAAAAPQAKAAPPAPAAAAKPAPAPAKPAPAPAKPAAAPAPMNVEAAAPAPAAAAAAVAPPKPAPPPPLPAPLDASQLSIEPGWAEPLGASPPPPGSTQQGVNFALWAGSATAVTLCLFDWDNQPLLEAPMQRSGEVWHAFVAGLPQSGVLYGYKVDGRGGWETQFRWDKNKILLDPYAKYVKGRAVFGQRDEAEQFKAKDGSVFRGTFDFEAEPFDWGKGYQKPDIPLKDLVIAELPVRLFTAAASSGLPEGQRGTYAGLASKVEHFKEMGINAVELLPVFEYDELEFQRSKNPRDHMVNVWGYSHLNFFAPMSRFGSDGKGPVAAAREFKEMVRTLHAAGIEVILDVVYNHTVEGGDDDPYLLSWRGIDCAAYYQQDPNAYTKLLNYSGCGNTVNANHPATMQQILDSLRWWVEEYHVDGFRFDLAPCLCRDAQGKVMTNPPLIRAISKDPVLSKVKLISEPWDIGAYMVGSFPNWDIWAEWNGKYRDDVRRFLRGDGGLKSEFATRLAGSADLYHTHERKPFHSINFVIAHDGFTLADLVAYNEKHNAANGEGNRDGTNDNFSWNCGVEGPTDNAAVNALRQRQMRNMHLALMLSQGTPMLLIGDEYGQSRGGNNNYYGHDTSLTHYHWDQLEEAKANGWFRFYSELIKLRREHPLLGRAEFLTTQDVTWHEDRWDDPESRFLAFTLHDRGQGGGSLYAAFNAHSFEVRITLPQPPSGKKWCRVVDTNLAPPKDFTPGGNGGVDPVYFVQPYSSILLVAKDKSWTPAPAAAANGAPAAPTK